MKSNSVVMCVLVYSVQSGLLILDSQPADLRL